MIDCKKIREEIFEELKPLVDPNKGLAIIHLGDDPGSKFYVDAKLKDAKLLGVPTFYYRHDSNNLPSEDQIISLIDYLNHAPNVGGIIVQLPLPSIYDTEKILNSISDNKDVDGFKVTSRFIPATPKGVITILDRIKFDLTGKKICMVGKGKTVGMPLIPLLLNKGATLTICGSKTPQEDLYESCYSADVIISAVGKPELINKDIYEIGKNPSTSELFYYFERLKDQVIIDVGISRIDGKQVGDVSKELWEYCERVTPWVNGCGLITRTELFDNLLRG